MDTVRDAMMLAGGGAVAVGVLYIFTAAQLDRPGFGEFGGLLVFFGLIALGGRALIQDPRKRSRRR